eukprot:jgi/Ulvmu1/5574/UM023_0111.1
MSSVPRCWVLQPVWKQCGSFIHQYAQRVCATARGRACKCSVPSLGTAQRMVFLSPSQAATQDLAATFSASRHQGDAYLIHGNLGSGKSAFCRAFVRFACGDDEMPVPSPTYLLLNTYDEEVMDGPPIHHLDLYRLTDPASQLRLDIFALLQSGTALVEWPERLSTQPDAYINMQIHPLRTDAAELACTMARSWGAALPAPLSDASQDVRWRMISLQGVGMSAIQRYGEGRQIIDDLGMRPGTWLAQHMQR